MQSQRTIAPDAVSVSVMPNSILRVTFENGEVRDFDARKELYPRTAYKSLKDQRALSVVRVENGVLTWDNELDLDPEWLYEESVPV